MSPGPLAGVRVIELAHVMAGPVCGLMLADLGADVVKVERLPRGDATRGFVPPRVGDESAAFMMMNRGKRGVALDLRSEAGLEALRRMLASADVVIENFRPGTMEAMGLGYDALAAVNPGLVYLSITGFGATGPLGGQGGFDLIAQGYAGLMSVTGEGPGREPVKVGAPITDITAGILGALGVVAALHERTSTRRGRRVETSLFEAGITQTYWQSAIALATGASPGPLGSAHPLAAPYQAFRTADGWVNVGASNQGTWMRLTDALGAPELQDDPRFRENADRMVNLEALVAELAPRFETRGTDEWLAVLEEAGVPAGPVASIGEMLEHPQTRAREMVVEVEHARLGKVRALGMPVKLSGGTEADADAADPRTGGAWVDEKPASTAPSSRGAPVLGQHTSEVLAEYGFSGAEVEALLESGAAVQG